MIISILLKWVYSICWQSIISIVVLVSTYELIFILSLIFFVLAFCFLLAYPIQSAPSRDQFSLLPLLLLLVPHLVLSSHLRNTLKDESDHFKDGSQAVMDNTSHIHWQTHQFCQDQDLHGGTPMEDHETDMEEERIKC